MSGSLKVDSKKAAGMGGGFTLRFDGGRTLEVFNVGEYGGVHAARDVAKVREKVFRRELGVCSEAFDPAAAAAQLARETSKTVTICAESLFYGPVGRTTGRLYTA